MARQIHLYDPPERFVAGTVGEPGARTFFLQARSHGRITSVALEKQQVQLLAEQVGRLLDEVARVAGDEAEISEPAEEPTDLGPLEQPIEEEFRVATLALGWDPRVDRLVIVAQALAEGEAEESAPLVDDDDTNPDGPDLLRVRLTAEQAREFARRAAAVVSAGRPPCPFCGLPLDPGGHVCPRQNGYRR
ncbi:MAG: DUF3090 family protein [Sporichthyaceae bacterium]